MKTPYIKSIYVAMQQLADITKRCIVNKNYRRVERCLAIADRIRRNGNAQIKNAVENVYVYSVSIWMEKNLNKDREQIFRLFPATLKAEYIHQINATGD